MILTLDIGNTQLFGGVFSTDGKLKLKFRKTSKDRSSSDEHGLFLRQVLRENGIDPNDVAHIVIASVVPEMNHSINSACIKYFDIRPLMLQAGLKTGLKIKVQNPKEMGADLVANAVAAVAQYPDQNLIVIDFGTATTVSVVNKNKEYLGGIIMPGLRLSVLSLVSGTAQLPSVEILVPDRVIGRTTVEHIQAGIYYSALGMIREVCERSAQEAFNSEKPMVIGTGGFANLFANAQVFDVIEQDLVLHGLFYIFQYNQTSCQ